MHVAGRAPEDQDMSARGLVVAAVLPFAACSHATKVAETPQGSESAAVAAAAAPTEPSVRSCSSDDQCSASELCVSSHCVAITPGLAECRATAHFDFDRADVRQADQPGLQRA